MLQPHEETVALVCHVCESMINSIAITRMYHTHEGVTFKLSQRILNVLMMEATTLSVFPLKSLDLTLKTEEGVIHIASKSELFDLVHDIASKLLAIENCITGHKQAISVLNTVEKLKAYDASTGWP